MKYYAFTLIDLVAAIVIVTLVGCLIFPSIQASRETARRHACMSNLRQIGVAMQQYHDTFQTLPGHKVGPGAGNRKSVFTNLVAVHGISAQKERNGRRRRDVTTADHLEARGGNRLGGERP